MPKPAQSAPEGYRCVEPLGGVVIEGSTVVGFVPDLVYVPLTNLWINDEYQRQLSNASVRQINTIGKSWDWDRYKAIDLAEIEGFKGHYEVIDGQHTAIAAAMNGKVEILPGLRKPMSTLKEKASSFIGINQGRIALTKAALFNAEVAAQDEVAIAVECAMSEAGVKLLHVPPQKGVYGAGETMAIGTMQQIAKVQGHDRLVALLAIGVAANATPISSMLLKALNVALPPDVTSSLRDKAVAYLRAQGVGRLEMMAKASTPAGLRSFETLADSLSRHLGIPARAGIRRK